MKCRNCQKEIDHLWNDMWELCDECGYRYDIETQRSLDGNCQSILRQLHIKIYEIISRWAINNKINVTPGQKRLLELLVEEKFKFINQTQMDAIADLNDALAYLRCLQVDNVINHIKAAITCLQQHHL